MKLLLPLVSSGLSALALAGLSAAQVTQAPQRIQSRTIEIEGVGPMKYGILVPEAPKGEERPLVLALHPGGGRMAGYGANFMGQIVLPALSDLRAVMIAPDVPARSWADPVSDRAVMALVEQVMRDHAIDRRRILVTGFSMGGRGTWFMSSRHADLFTGAIALAASTGDEPIERLGRIPTYVIHSRDDEVVSFGNAEQTVRRLEELKRVVHFEPLSGPGHYAMGGYVEPLRRAGRWMVERWNAGR
jgi:predicted peptidase